MNTHFPGHTPECDLNKMEPSVISNKYSCTCDGGTPVKEETSTLNLALVLRDWFDLHDVSALQRTALIEMIDKYRPKIESVKEIKTGEDILANHARNF